MAGPAEEYPRRAWHLRADVGAFDPRDLVEELRSLANNLEFLIASGQFSEGISGGGSYNHGTGYVISHDPKVTEESYELAVREWVRRRE